MSNDYLSAFNRQNVSLVTQPLERIERDTDRDYILQASEAVTYGLVDQVIAKRE